MEFYLSAINNIHLPQNASSCVNSGNDFILRIQYCSAFFIPSSVFPELALWALSPRTQVLADNPILGSLAVSAKLHLIESLQALLFPPQGRGLQVH